MIAPEINKGIATLVICLFVTGTVCGFALATLQIALKPEVEIPACKPLPSAGQCDLKALAEDVRDACLKEFFSSGYKPVKESSINLDAIIAKHTGGK